jgi:transcriptional regulator with XRE-family HTH domain
VTSDRLDEAVAFLRLVGRRVAQAREAAGMTQAELASHLGLTAEAISGVERGEYGITVDQLHRVAEVLGLCTADLVPDIAAVRQLGAGGPPDDAQTHRG